MTSEIARGDILVSEWGYEQTNVEFFLVVKRSGESVTLQRIGDLDLGSTGPFSGKKRPLASRPIGQPFRRKVLPCGNDRSMVRIRGNYAFAHPWDGTDRHYSWGH